MLEGAKSIGAGAATIASAGAAIGSGKGLTYLSKGSRDGLHQGWRG